MCAIQGTGGAARKLKIYLFRIDVNAAFEQFAMLLDGIVESSNTWYTNSATTQ